MSNSTLPDQSILQAQKSFVISQGEFSMEALERTQEVLSAELASLATALGQVANTLQHFGKIRIARRTPRALISCQVDSRELNTVVAGHGLFSEHPKQNVSELLSSL